ncbi:MAG: hypothetical protein NTX22_15480 [Ignavibacteriales bacterium]|nr:hypothetical protein [Ignavibacteriales bacterium]
MDMEKRIRIGIIVSVCLLYFLYSCSSNPYIKSAKAELKIISLNKDSVNYNSQWPKEKFNGFKETIEFSNHHYYIYLKNDDSILISLISADKKDSCMLFNNFLRSGKYELKFKTLDVENGLYFIKYSNIDTTYCQKIILMK